MTEHRSGSVAQLPARQTAVTFRNRQGLKLFGILEEPPGRATTDMALLLLSPGVKMRVGPQCLYRRIAREFLAFGIPVLRFDFFGLGDSEGLLPEELLRDVYNHIEVGRFVDDTVDAMDWVQRKYGITRFLLAGLCGGAITGLLAGERDRRVVGLFGIGLTAVLASRAAETSRYMTVGQLKDSQRLYLRRLSSPQAWYRLLTLQADNRLIRRMVVHAFRRHVLRAEPVTSPPPPEDDNANPRFSPAFFTMLETRRPILLVFGGSDRLHWEFEEKFVARHREGLAPFKSLYDVHVVPQANHVLTAEEWQREMIDVMQNWLQRHFSQDLAARPQTAGT